MNQDVVNIITKRGGRRLKELSDAERNDTIALHYVGSLLALKACDIYAVAADVNRDMVTAKALNIRWRKLYDAGDTLAHLVKMDCAKLLKDGKLPITPPSKGNTYCMGWVFTPEDERRETIAKRETIKFFAKYGKGEQPRLYGEHYQPKENAPEEGKELWLTLSAAAMYCGCSNEAIVGAYRQGLVERREYATSSNRHYYEYKLSDLENLIKFLSKK